jgi:phenylacetate-CoA ligase
MTPSAWLQKVHTKGLTGVLAHLDPQRAVHRRAYVSEAVALRQRLLQGLAGIWCGQAEAVAALRADMLRELLAHSGRRIPYYRQLFERLGLRDPGPADLAKIPLLDKPLVRAHQANLCLPGWHKHVHYPMNTGGSTGQPLEFIVDSLAGCAAAAHQEFAFRLMGFRNGDRIAAFNGVAIADELRRDRIYWVPRAKPAELPYGSVSYSTHYMDAQTLPLYFKSLDDAGFAFLLGYPAAIHSLARYCLDHACLFRRPIKSVQLTSEVVLESQITDIEKAFQTKVYLQYGMSEVAVYAHTFDASREYLCSPLMGWVEVLDGAGRHVKPGEEGELVLTGFHNRLMPFVRYRPGDRAVYGGERDGVVVLRQVLGRSQDYVVRPDGTRISLTGLVFGQHFKAFARIARWQIFQDEPGKVTVRVITLPGFGAADRDEITEKFRSLADVHAAIEVVETIPLTPQGKHLFLVQKIPARLEGHASVNRSPA